MTMIANTADDVHRALLNRVKQKTFIFRNALMCRCVLH